jgi:CRISPR-associated protein Cas5 subtype I-B
MKGFQLEISGNWGHFKKPETNNNPLSHDFITKTAFIGMIGAVLGIERQEMKDYFPKTLRGSTLRSKFAKTL